MFSDWIFLPRLDLFCSILHSGYWLTAKDLKKNGFNKKWFQFLNQNFQIYLLAIGHGQIGKVLSPLPVDGIFKALDRRLNKPW